MAERSEERESKRGEEEGIGKGESQEEGEKEKEGGSVDHDDDEEEGRRGEVKGKGGEGRKGGKGGGGRGRGKKESLVDLFRDEAREEALEGTRELREVRFISFRFVSFDFRGSGYSYPQRYKTLSKFMDHSKREERLAWPPKKSCAFHKILTGMNFFPCEFLDQAEREGEGSSREGVSARQQRLSATAR